MTIPTHLQYTADHEWIAVTDGVATVGVTAFAADALGEVVYVELPTIGSALRAGAPCGEIESTKSVSDLLSPADGEVTEVNSAAADNPGLVNSDPFGDGWLFRMTLSAEPTVLDSSQYAELTGGDQ